MQEIIVTFNENGDPIISAHGIKGKSCIDATKFLEKALGQKQDDIKTNEYYDSTNQYIHIKR